MYFLYLLFYYFIKYEEIKNCSTFYKDKIA